MCRERTNIKSWGSFAYYALQAGDEFACCAVGLLNVAGPVRCTGAQDDLGGVRGHGV
jgi:hypothetical protein